MDDKNRRIIHNGKRDSTGVVPVYDRDRSNVLVATELGGYEEPNDQGFDFRSAIDVLLARKWMIIAITVFGLILTFLMTLRVVPLYSSAAIIEIQPQDVQIFEGTNVAPDLVADTAYMETQYRLIRSRSISEKVAEDLELLNDPRYATLELPRELRLLQATSIVASGIRVSAVGRSRLVGIRFESQYPQETARIANGVAEAYIQSNIQRKFDTTAFAREFLEDRLATTKQLLEESERNFTRYAEEQGLLDLGGIRSEGASLDENAIISLNSELSAAESERIRAEQEYRITAETSPSIELLQSDTLAALRQARSTLLADYQEMSNRFKPDYPDMVRLRSRIDRIETDIASEAETIVAARLNNLKLEYDAALARESSLRTRVDQLKIALQDERNRRIQYRILQREVETVRAQYEALLQRSKEVSIASGVGSTNVSIIDRALVPSFPFQPNMTRSLLQAFVLSLALGIGLAFALNYLDDTIKTPEDVRNRLGQPIIGVIPRVSKRKDFASNVFDQPKSMISEAIATAQTALEFSTPEGLPRSLLVTSTRPGEGKTSTTVSLAVAFARSGKQTLIIDADMRKPSFVVDTKKSIGLSGLLTGTAHAQEHTIRSKTPGLSILPAGIIPPDPAQLLAGRRLREIINEVEALFDIVIIDSPPILNFADGPRLGSMVDGAVVVIESGLIRTPAAHRTLIQLRDARTNILGCMLTKFNNKKFNYDYGYYYTSYGEGQNAKMIAGSKRDSKRSVLIDVEDDADNEIEIERWG